jgi:hypothetical protein
MTGRYCVYGYFRPFAPIEPIYIGQGRDQRPYSHLRLARGRAEVGLHGNRRLIECLRAGLALGFEPPIVIIRDGLTRDAAEDLERLLIRAIGREPNGPLLNANAGVRPLDEPIVERPWQVNRDLRRRDPLGLA